MSDVGASPAAEEENGRVVGGPGVTVRGAVTRTDDGPAVSPVHVEVAEAGPSAGSRTGPVRVRAFLVAGRLERGETVRFSVKLAGEVKGGLKLRAAVPGRSYCPYRPLDVDVP